MLKRTLTLLAAAALVAAAANEGTAGDAASSKRFVSKRYGYSLTLTTAWDVYEPKQRWNGGTPFPDTVDTYSGAVIRRALLAAARRLSAGTTLDDFTAQVIGKTPGNCGQPEANLATKLGGEPARRFTHHCSGGWYLINVTAVHRGRGYVFISSSRAGNDRVDIVVFNRAARSWQFID